jgi:hypothetical protein
MKELVLLSLLLPLLGISCAHTNNRHLLFQERQIVPDTKLFEDRYSLWECRHELPLAAHRYLLARDGKQETIIRTSEDLAPWSKKSRQPNRPWNLCVS